MTHWIFKVSSQELYPDEPGQRYVYDNTHSVHVSAGDSFIYLDKDKRKRLYAFTGHGIVKNVRSRSPRATEVRHPKVKRVYMANLGDFVPYSQPVDIRPDSLEGGRNRAALGITDVNKLGWSASIARLHPTMYEHIVGLAYQQGSITMEALARSDYEVPDTWSSVRTRHSLERFKVVVLRRQNYTCAICSTKIREVLDVAHVSAYAADAKNRANPANGIGLCAYCHRAFDQGVFMVHEDGTVLTNSDVERDPVARAHLTNLSCAARMSLLKGVDKVFLRKRLAGVL